MSDGAAIVIGLCIGAIIVVAFLALAPFASDTQKTNAEQTKMVAGFLRVQRFLTVALAVALLVAVFTLGALQIVFTGISFLLAVAGTALLTRKARAIG